MIEKIIHLSDIHIRTLKMHQEYSDVFDETYENIRSAIDGIPKENVRIVVTGDIVHQKIIVSNEQMLVMSKFLKGLSSIARTIVIAGNHDMLENNLSRLDSITPVIELLGDENISYYKKSECILDDDVVWCVYSIFDGNEPPDIISAREEYGHKKLYAALFHGPLNGSTTDLGFTIESGYPLSIFAGCDVALCGDIHKYGEFRYEGCKIVYAGSLIQQDYGEDITGHGFVVWDVPSRTYSHYEVANQYRYYKFRLDGLADMDHGTEVLSNG